MSHFVATLRGIQDMVRQRGTASLWRGLTLTLWRDVPFSGIYWWGYETIRGRLTDRREMARRGRRSSSDGIDGEAAGGLGRGGAGGASRGRARARSQSRENHAATFVDSFTAGALSGAFASIVTMPFDVGLEGWEGCGRDGNG